MMMYPTIDAIAEAAEPMDYSLLDEASVDNKTIENTFMYSVNNGTSKYGKAILSFITNAQRIDTKSDAFRDIDFDIRRRRISEALSKVVMSPNVVICIGEHLLPKILRVFTCKDPKDGGKYKLFIDASDFITYKNGFYSCSNLDWFISYIIGGMVDFIYHQDPSRLVLDQIIIGKGCLCFTRLLSYVIDRIVKISSVPQIKSRIDYLCNLYYQVNLLGKDLHAGGSYNVIRNNAIKYSAISDMDAAKVDSMIQPEDFDDIDKFIKAIARIFDININTTAVISTWVTSFQPGTQLALEFLPSFAMMITNAYVGGYLVNQNLIEKICGIDMVNFAKQLIKINEGAVS